MGFFIIIILFLSSFLFLLIALGSSRWHSSAEHRAQKGDKDRWDSLGGCSQKNFFHPLIKQKWVKLELKFQGLEIRNGTIGIYIVYDSRGRPTGEAFVQFCNSEDTDLAMKKNREKIGHRSVAPRQQLGI